MFKRHPGSIFVLAVVGAGLLVSSSPKAMAAERVLAGIRVGRKSTAILKKYGNPTRIEVGAGAGLAGATVQRGTTGLPGAGMPGTPGGGMMGPGGGAGMMRPGGMGMPGGGMPGMGGGMPGMMGGGMGGRPGMMGGGAGAGMPGMMGGGLGGGGGATDANLPRGGRGPGMGMMGGGGMPGMMGGGAGAGMPGMMGGGGMPGMGMMGRGPMLGGGSGSGALPPVTGSTPMPGGIGAIGTGGAGQQQVVRWIYEFKNVVLEFTIDDGDGTVLQITAIGERWPQARLSRGITLGSTYKDVINKYRFPESHSDSGGGMIITNYRESEHFSLVLQDKKVIAITVALVQ